jgi:hypothetical protein
MGNKNTEGEAIDVTSPGGAVTIQKGELYRVNKWNGFAMATVLPTDPELGFALQANFDVWWITVPSGCAGAVAGDLLYWSGSEGFKAGPTDLTRTQGTITAPACKVVTAPDGNNIAAVRALNAG